MTWFSWDTLITGHRYRIARAEVFVLKKVQRYQAQALFCLPTPGKIKCTGHAFSPGTPPGYMQSISVPGSAKSAHGGEAFCSHGHALAKQPGLTFEILPQTSLKLDANYKSNIQQW